MILAGFEELEAVVLEKNKVLKFDLFAIRLQRLLGFFFSQTVMASYVHPDSLILSILLPLYKLECKLYFRLINLHPEILCFSHNEVPIGPDRVI